MTKLKQKRRHKQKQQSPHSAASVANKLAQWWRAGSHKLVEQVETTMARKDADRVFDMAAELLTVPEATDFTGFLYEIAQIPDVILHDAQGNEADYDIAIFGVVLQGYTQAIDSLVANNEAFHEFARLFRKTGIAADTSNVVVCPLPIDILNLAQLTPVDIRQVAKAMIRLLGATGKEGMASMIDSVVDYLRSRMTVELTVPSSLATANFGTRVLLGARFRPAHGEADVLGAEDRDDDVSDEVVLAAHEAFMREASALLERHGITGVTVSSPAEWSAIHHLAGTYRIEGMLETEAAQLGVRVADASELHVGVDDDSLWVTARVGGHVLGPVAAPLYYAPHVLPDLIDGLPTPNARLVDHDSVSAMMVCLKDGRADG